MQSFEEEDAQKQLEKNQVGITSARFLEIIINLQNEYHEILPRMVCILNF